MKRFLPAIITLLLVLSLAIAGCEGSSSTTTTTTTYATGSAWTCTASTPGFSARYGHTCVVFNNKMWVIGGITNDGFTNDVWYACK